MQKNCPRQSAVTTLQGQDVGHQARQAHCIHLTPLSPSPLLHLFCSTPCPALLTAAIARELVNLRSPTKARHPESFDVLCKIQAELAELYDALVSAVRLPGTGSRLNTVALNIQSKHHGAIASHRDAKSDMWAVTTATKSSRSMTVFPRLLWTHGLGPRDAQFIDGAEMHSIMAWVEGAKGKGEMRSAVHKSRYRFSATFFAKE